MRAEMLGCQLDGWVPLFPTPTALVAAERAQAEEVWKRGHTDGAPAEKCQCGIWVLRESRIDIGMRIPSDYRKAAAVAGEVRFWGRAYEYELGWRVQYARPTALYRLWDPKHEERMQALAERYGVQIREHPVLERRVREMKRAAAARPDYYQQPWVTSQVLGLAPTSRRPQPKNTTARWRRYMRRYRAWLPRT